MAQTLLEASIDFATSGDTTIIAASAGNHIRVEKIFLVVAGDVNLVFKDGATALTGAIPMKANGSITLDIDPRHPWFTTTIASAFVINSSAAVQISGRVYYSLLPV